MRKSTLGSPRQGNLKTVADVVRAARRAEEKRKIAERISESKAAQLWLRVRVS